MNKEIKKTIPDRGDLPERGRRHPLVGAILGDMHDERQASERRYLSEGSMALLNRTGDTGPVAAIPARD